MLRFWLSGKRGRASCSADLSPDQMVNTTTLTARGRDELRADGANRAGPARAVARGQQNGLAGDAGVDAAALHSGFERDGSNTGVALRDGDGAGIPAGGVTHYTTLCRARIGRPLSLVGEELGKRSLTGTQQAHRFRNLRTRDVVLIRRYSHRCQDADDRDHDHQFDQREALLKITHL